MADADQKPEEEGAEEPKKGSKMPLILGLVMALLGGGGGFAAVQMGLIGGSSDAADHDGDSHGEPDDLEAEPLPELAFVPLETLVINLPQHAQARHLLFTAQLEVAPEFSEEVTGLIPRVVDVLNGYLRSVRVEELEDPTALIRLRAQMLRRVQVVVGEGRVKDILIMEFVLN